MKITVRQRKVGPGRAPGSVRVRVVGAAGTPRIVRRPAAVRPGALPRRRAPR